MQILELGKSWENETIATRGIGYTRKKRKAEKKNDKCIFGLRLAEFVLGRLCLPDSLPFRSQKSIGFFTSPKLVLSHKGTIISH